MALTPKQIIRMEYGDSKNFMTPKIRKTAMLVETTEKAVAYEISEGRGLNGDKIFGISLVLYDCNSGETERLSDFCELRPSLESAKEALPSIRTNLRVKGVI